jgi:glycosyltransferase involved in cell wall biosynthesis
MTTCEQLDGVISIASNTIGSPTGYGMQGELLTKELIRHGLKVANLSNYGLEGSITTLKVGKHEIAHYPRGYQLYSDDVIGLWHSHFASQFPNKKSVVLGLYDVWVWNNMQYDGDFIAWVPLDHITLPPAVAHFLKKDKVRPVTMAPHGQRQLQEANIDSTYIPHMVDTTVMKPTKKIFGQDTREYMGLSKHDYLVTMVAANKANGGFFHRKAFAENLLAFSLFAKTRPNAKLYIHTEPSAVYGGFNLPVLLQSVGLQPEQVLFPHPVTYRTGYPSEALAAFYTASDVVLSVSYGEGFGVPQMEAQACGSRVITSNFAASPDLAGPDSWLVDGQPFWDEKQAAFFQIPHIPSIVKALEQAYESERGTSESSIEFAKQFSVRNVFDNMWLPYLRDFFA